MNTPAGSRKRDLIMSVGYYTMFPRRYDCYQFDARPTNAADDGLISSA